MTKNQPQKTEVRFYTFSYVSPGESMARLLTVQAKDEDRALTVVEDQLEEFIGNAAYEVEFTLVSTSTRTVEA